MTTERENPLRAEKRKKLHALREAGIDPFPHTFEKKNNCAQVRKDYDSLQSGEKKEDVSVTMAGRLMTLRDMGKACFFNMQDQSGGIQCYIRSNELSERDQQFLKYVDLGDIIGVTGFPFRTQKGELSVHVKSFSILTKTLEPLPEKFHGIADIEIKYRNRHLDLITSEESRQVFEKRSKIIAAFREFLNNRGFLEVETPVLQPIYGGAAAKPFTTHHNALDMKLYLRISPELYLKRLIVGGFEKVYEISKQFRNEGIDRTHNPEFTMMEYYEAYTDYEYQMKQFEEIIAYVAQKVNGTTQAKFGEHTIEFKPPWRRLKVLDAVKEYGKFDPSTMSDADLFKKIKSLGCDWDKPKTKGEMIMEAVALCAEEHLIQPTFLMDFPVEVSPLTKKHRTTPGLVERFEPICAGMELGNSYTELNDPEDQLARLKEQDSKRKVDDEAQPMDEDFMHAIDTGMPPTGGVGIGIERIVMLLTNQTSIRDILLFPTMKNQ